MIVFAAVVIRMAKSKRYVNGNFNATKVDVTSMKNKKKSP